MATDDHALVRNAGPLWGAATRSPFLDALAAGDLPADALLRWLAQDYVFAKNLMAFQALLLAKASRDCHKPLIQGLSALDREMDWFEAHAGVLRRKPEGTVGDGLRPALRPVYRLTLPLKKPVVQFDISLLFSDRLYDTTLRAVPSCAGA